MGAHTSTRVRLVRGQPEDCPAVRDLEVASRPLGASSPVLTVVRCDDDASGAVRCGGESGETAGRSEEQRDTSVLREIIKQRIRARTSERIRDLDVLCEPGRIVIRGRCATFYTKQLAQHAAMGVIEDETLVNELAVGIR